MTSPLNVVGRGLDWESGDQESEDLWTLVSSSVTQHNDACFFLATATLLLLMQGVVNCEGLGRGEVSE